MAIRSFLMALVCASALAACSPTQAAGPAGATCEEFGASPSIAQSRTIDAGADLTVRGLEPGTATLSLRYGQPWEGGAQGEWTYSLEVTVR